MIVSHPWFIPATDITLLLGDLQRRDHYICSAKPLAVSRQLYRGDLAYDLPNDRVELSIRRRSKDRTTLQLTAAANLMCLPSYAMGRKRLGIPP
jgi:hypothetical protein